MPGSDQVSDSASQPSTKERPTPEERAARVLEVWEQYEGESMREGHASTLTTIVATAIRAAEQDAAEKERAAIARAFDEHYAAVPRNSHGRCCEFAGAGIRARSLR